jgi:hypothetical protein
VVPAVFMERTFLPLFRVQWQSDLSHGTMPSEDGHIYFTSFNKHELLIFALVHHSFAAVPRLHPSAMLHNATADPLQGWVKNNDRGTQNIITSCFSIIMLCLWSMLHLNLPAPDDTMWTIILQRARWMFLGFLYPELVMCFAYAQMMSAINSHADMMSIDVPPEYWSVVHGFYADMGGLVLKAPDFDAFPITAKQLYILVANGVLPLPELHRREITDKSKGNWFVKGIAVWQTGYILITIIIRLAKGLAVTPLEILTATIGFCAFVTILLWWRKPLDVETPTTISSELMIAEIIQLIGPSTMGTWSDTPLDFAECDIYLSRKWGRGLTNWIISLGLQSRPMKRNCLRPNV